AIKGTLSWRFLRTMTMRPVPRLAAIATAVPPHALDQSAVVARLERLFGRSPELDRLLPVFAHSGVERRYAAAPLEWFDEPRGWAERNRRYLAAAADLLERLAGRLLDRAGIAAEACGGCRFSVSAAPAARSAWRGRRRLPWRSRSGRCCFSSSNCAACRSAAATPPRATSSPPRCSATAPRVRSLPAAAMARRSPPAANTNGPTVST